MIQLILSLQFLYFCLNLLMLCVGHLERKFLITESEWRQIKLNIDSKCRTAHRRKMLGLPLTVKRFGGLSETSDIAVTDHIEYSSSQSAAQVTCYGF